MPPAMAPPSEEENMFSKGAAPSATPPELVDEAEPQEPTTSAQTQQASAP